MFACSLVVVAASEAQAEVAPRAGALVFVIHDASFDEFTSYIGSAFASGRGEGLLTDADVLVAQARQLSSDLSRTYGRGLPLVRVTDLGTPRGDALSRKEFYIRALSKIRTIAGGIERNGEQLIVVATVGGLAGDGPSNELNAIFMSDTSADRDGSLTSSTTRRSGVVDGSDLRATVASYLGLPGENYEGAMTVEPEAVNLAELNARHLAQRRMYVPVSIAAIVAVFLIGTVALSVFSRRARVSLRTLRLGLWACLATPALAVAMLAAGHLPRLDYVSVALILVAIALILPVAALAFRRKGLLAPPAVFGIAIFGLLVVEAGTGWYGTMFTLLGGTALDGARFYGLPNAFEGLLVGSAVYVAAVLTPRWGYAWILLTALFIGFPRLGADLGGALVTLVAAGLWLALRSRGRMDRWGVAVIAATVVVGMGVVLLAHRFAASPTHGTAFVEASAGDPMNVLSTLWERLGVGVRLLRRNPLGLTYLAATPVLLWLVIKQRAGLRDSFAAFPHWRSAMLTILWASVVAYFVNDTGVSAVGMGFAMALGGILYVPLAREAVSMDAR